MGLWVSIPEKREIPFEAGNSETTSEKEQSVSIPEKREIPFEVRGLISHHMLSHIVSIPEKREIPFEVEYADFRDTVAKVGFNP